jgi:hypothetical protein
MTVVLFVTHFFKRKNSYSFLFSSAISEGIKDMFKEMGYGLNAVKKKENRKDQPSQNGQG